MGSQMSCYFSMTACGWKSAFRLQTKYEVCRVTSPALFKFFSRKECGEQLPLLVLKAPGKHSPEISSHYFSHFQWYGLCPFFPPAISLSWKESGALGKSFPDCPPEVGWVGLTMILGSQIPWEIWGLFSAAYNSSGLVYNRKLFRNRYWGRANTYSAESALIYKSAQAFMLYYPSRGDNWCEISKVKTPQPRRQKRN